MIFTPVSRRAAASIFRCCHSLSHTKMTSNHNISQLLQLVRRVDNFYLNDLRSSSYIPFKCDNHQVGLISKEVLQNLREYRDVFKISEEEIVLDINTVQERNDAIEKVLKDLRAKGAFLALKGWRDECYEIRGNFGEPPLFKMERSATPLFGVRQYGVHINGYVNHPEHGLCLWLQRRSPNKPTWPNMLDSFVGGGLSEGNSVMVTAVKEAGEEANVPQELSSRGLRPAGSVSFMAKTDRGIHPNTEFVFDLQLDADFQPSNNDGEVAGFQLTKASDLIGIICSQEFKSTSVPVVIDWMIRHGLVNVENEANLPEIVELIHLPLHNLYK